MSVTVRDVAALAGVSPATVSRTCNNHPSIRPETREKVWAAISELGYQVTNPAINDETNPAMDVCQSPSSVPKTIGIIMRPLVLKEYDNHFVASAIKGICQKAIECDYSAIVISCRTYEQTLEYVQKLHAQHRIQGFVFLYSLLDDPLVAFCHDENIPFVVIGKASSYVNETVYVDNDNLSAGQDAATYLIHMGHTKIAFACDDIAQIFAYERYAGFRLAMIQNGLDINDDYLLYDISLPLGMDSALADLLRSDRCPTALIMADDGTAMAAVQLCHELGIKLPDELSIITFNNSIVSQLANPPLTVIDINTHQLGAEALNQLINMINDPDMEPTKIIVPHTLIERKSCCPPLG